MLGCRRTFDILLCYKYIIFRIGCQVVFVVGELKIYFSWSYNFNIRRRSCRRWFSIKLWLELWSQVLMV